MSVSSSETVTFSEFTNSLSNPVILGIVDFQPLNGDIIIELASNLGFAMIDRMLGGQGQPLDKARDFSEIEMIILEKLMVVCMQLMREPWKNVIDINPVMERIETKDVYKRQKYNKVLQEDLFKVRGRVVNVVGLTTESKGPQAKLGDICLISSRNGGTEEKPVQAEVVGFKEGKVLLMPYDKVEGIGPGSVVENTGHALTVKVSEELLGKTLNGLGRICLLYTSIKKQREGYIENGYYVIKKYIFRGSKKCC